MRIIGCDLHRSQQTVAMLDRDTGEEVKKTLLHDGDAVRDLRALLLHRHQWVRMRTRVQNALQAIALGHGLRRGQGLWTRDGQAALSAITLPPNADARRTALLALYASLNDEVEQLDARV